MRGERWDARALSIRMTSIRPAETEYLARLPMASSDIAKSRLIKGRIIQILLNYRLNYNKKFIKFSIQH